MGNRMIRKSSSEPDFRTACGWWPDLEAIWTPVGWKNHLFRFNVFSNGMILAQPDLNRRTEKWQGQGTQLTFVASPFYRFDDFVPIQNTAYTTEDDNTIRQGWESTDAPVLWSEFGVE